MDAAGAVDGQNPSTAPWKTADGFPQASTGINDSLYGDGTPTTDFAELDVHNYRTAHPAHGTFRTAPRAPDAPRAPHP
ncbi:MAG TPA: hypothetical protein VFI62_02550, partial [Burkholderiales bacterium]|nr:hypothetical protein [Burkholderiales bacterium]